MKVEKNKQMAHKTVKKLRGWVWGVCKQQDIGTGTIKQHYNLKCFAARSTTTKAAEQSEVCYKIYKKKKKGRKKKKVMCHY